MKVQVLFAILSGLVSAVPAPEVETTSTATILGYESQLINSISVSNPAMCYLHTFDNNPELFISSFNGMPFSTDAVYRVQDIASSLKSTITASKLSPNVNWPNGITYAPASVFGDEGILVAGGFLVKGKGDIYYAERHSDGSMGAFKTLHHSNEFFYHQIVLHDVDGDGQQDIITCRAKKSGPKFALTWLTPSDRSNPKGPWKETIIAEQNGCDTYFEMIDLDGDGKEEIVAPLFWGQSFVVTSSSTGRFDNPDDIEITTIDNTVGKAFDIKHVDVNGDGKKDILISNHQGKNDNPSGSLYAFTCGKNYKDASSWKRYTLSDGIKPITGFFSIGAGAPGTPLAFYPKTSQTSGKPAIVMAGDDAQKMYVVEPDSQDSNDWSYTTKVLHDCKGTVGTPAVGDVDGDGFTDIFVPCYTKGQVHVYSFTE